MTRHSDASLLELLLESGIDVRRRLVFLHCDMDSNGSGIEQVVRGLVYLDKTAGTGDGHIELWINSPGGYVAESFGLYDVIRQCQHEVWTIGFGEICSAAGLILACGDRRFATPSAFFMSHEMQLDDGELSYIAAENRLDFHRRLNDLWATRMAHHTKHTKKWWLELHKGATRELWLTPSQMKQHGIIDEVWTGTPPRSDD